VVFLENIHPPGGVSRPGGVEDIWINYLQSSLEVWRENENGIQDGHVDGHGRFWCRMALEVTRVRA
jgi:hypothetical protein